MMPIPCCRSCAADMPGHPICIRCWNKLPADVRSDLTFALLCLPADSPDKVEIVGQALRVLRLQAENFGDPTAKPEQVKGP